MSKRTRRILFYLGCVIFFAGSYIAILYAQGYKYNFDTQAFQRTGAIQLRVSDDAKVFIDDELVGSTSLFGNSYAVGGLLPGDYIVRLEREGFTPWQKTITVQEGFITDFSRILILPMSEAEAPKVLEEVTLALASELVVVATKSAATPTPSVRATPKASVSPLASASISNTPNPTAPFKLENRVLYVLDDGISKPYATNVSGFALTENRRKVLWWNDRDLWVGLLADTDYQPYRKNGERDLVLHLTNPIKKAAWFRGEDHIVVDSVGYKVVEIDQRGGLNIIRL